MKKILLPFAAISMLSIAVACDDGGTSVACEVDDDCVDEAVNTVCDPDVLVCVAPSDPVCADDTDCDLAGDDNPGEPADCSADADCGDEEVCIADGVGNTYCNIDPEGVPCADFGFEDATIDGKDTCIVDSGDTCDADGQCVAE